MKEHSRKLLAKAMDTIEGAEGLLNMEKEELAAGRAYYAMFYIAEALFTKLTSSSASMVSSLRRMASILPKQKSLILNFITG